MWHEVLGRHILRLNLRKILLVSLRHLLLFLTLQILFELIRVVRPTQVCRHVLLYKRRKGVGLNIVLVRLRNGQVVVVWLILEHKFVVKYLNL